MLRFDEILKTYFKYFNNFRIRFVELVCLSVLNACLPDSSTQTPFSNLITEPGWCKNESRKMNEERAPQTVLFYLSRDILHRGGDKNLFSTKSKLLANEKIGLKFFFKHYWKFRKRKKLINIFFFNFLKIWMIYIFFK